MNRHVVKKLRKLLCILASLALLAVPLSLVPAGRAAHAEVNPGPGETIHTSKATVKKTFVEYDKFKKVSTQYRLLKWEITVTTPSEEDWNDLSYIDLVDDPETWQCHYLARRVELIDGTLLYSDSGFNREQSSNTGDFTDEGKIYFDTSLVETDKTKYPFDIENGCLKLRLKKDNLSPEKDYTFVVYTHVTDDSKLSKRSFKNDVRVLTTFKDTLTGEEDEDTAESGVLKTTEKIGKPVGKGGEVEYTVTFDIGAYAKKLHMQNRTLYPNDKIVFYDEIKYGYLEYVPDSAVLSCDMFQSEYNMIPYSEFTGNLEVSTDGGKTTFTYTMADELMSLFDYTTGTFTYHDEDHDAQFNPILKIKYLAKLTDEEARELTLSQEKENVYRNEVKVSYNGVVVGQDTEDVILTANKVLDKKYVRQGARIKYTVTVNPDEVKFNDDGSRLYAKDVAGANLRIKENSIKVSDENGELEKNQYDYKIEKDQNGDNVLKFNIPDGKALTITYSALIDVAGNIIQPTDRVANTFYLYKHEDVMEIDRVSNSIESGDFVQNSSARATVRLSKVWFNGQKYVPLSDCKFELYECRVEDGIVLIGDRVSFSKDNNIYMADIDGTESDISISEEGVTLKELDYAKLYLLHETEAPNPLNKTDYYFIVSNDSGNDATLKISDEEYESKYKDVTDKDGNSLEIHKYKDSNAQFEIEDFVEFELDAKKTVKYADGSEAPMGTYAFKIEEVDVDLADAVVIENGYSAIATNDEEGNIEFDPIRVNMTQDEEYYYYKVSEYTAGLPDDVIGDDTFYIITMHVKRKDNGEFNHNMAYTKYERDNEEAEYSYKFVNADDIKFTNTIKKTFGTLMIDDIAGQTYSGSAITPDVTVKDGNTTLVKDQDYTVSYSNNVNAAESTAENAPTVTITGIGAYYGTITKKFTINKADIPATAIHAPVGIADLTYNGSEQALVQRGSVEGNVGTVYYAITDTTATTAPTDGWTETVAKATYIGDYKVWYKVIGDANHNNVDAVALTNMVTIAKSTATPKGLAGTLAAPYLADKVGKVSLPTGWSWDDSDKDTALQVGVPVTKTAKYSGADQDNYEVEALSKEVTITRSACKHPKTEVRDKVVPTSDREGYSGDTYCLDCGVLVKKGDVEAKTFKPVTVNYVTHIQNVGWEKTAKKNGETSGTTGSSLRLEGIRIKVTGNENLGIRYTTHCQDYGWLAWSRDGEMSGTEGESKRLEAIMINLTGADKDKYDVYYRVHAQNVGWMNWAKNGEAAGTAGYGYRLEALQIEVVKKGEKPVNVGKITTNSTKNYEDKNKQAAPKVDGSEVPNVSYRTHVQNVGWQAWKVNGGFAGTSGRSLRLEGINIKLTNKDHTGGIRYKTHIQNLGWEKTWRTDGEMSGTSGRSLRLEAIDLELYGDMAEYYDIYYRVHAQDVGWMGWAANGADAGTAGYARRLEGIQVVLVAKGAAAPAANYGGITSVTSKPYLQR